MKHTLLFIGLLLSAANLFAQVPDPFVYSEDWYGYRMIIDGEHYVRPSPNDELEAPRLYVTKGAPDTLVAVVCSTLTADIEFLDMFTCIISNVSFDPPSCEQEQNAIFEELHFEFFQNVEDAVINYQVSISSPSEPELGPVTLQFWDPVSSDLVRWGDYPLSTIDNSIAQIALFPNPAVDVLSWSNLPAATYKASIYSAQGKLLQQQEVTSSSINVAALNSGMYFIELSDGTNVSRSKFIKR